MYSDGTTPCQKKKSQDTFLFNNEKGIYLYTDENNTESTYTAQTIEMLAKYLPTADNGRISEIRLYNRVLSDKEVENNFKYQQQ